MKKSPAYFRDYLKILAAKISFAATSRALGDSEDLIFKWLTASKAAMQRGDDPSEFFFSLDPDDEEDTPRWLHEHVRSAVTNSVQMIEAAARNRALNGTFTPAAYQGNIVYKINPDWLDEGLRNLLGLTDADRYLRDKVTGELVPEMVWTPPSTDLVIAILAAHSKIYKKQSSIDVNMNARVTGGVVVMPRNPPAISAPLPMVEILQAATDEPDDKNETVSDLDDDDDATTPASRSSDDAPAPADRPLLASERAGKPLSDLERDLLSKMPGARK